MKQEAKRRKPDLDEQYDEIAAQLYAKSRGVELEGHPGCQRRMKECILTQPVFYGFKPAEIPAEIKQIVEGYLPTAAVAMLWVLPAPFLYRDADDPKKNKTELSDSPREMWETKKYRPDVEDYMRVMADNLSPLLSPRKRK